MPRPRPLDFFKQSLKTDAYVADEIINTYLLRPIAAGIVWLLYPASVTPNQVTIVAILVGLASACEYLLGSPAAIAFAGVLIVLKDILDDADGQLARAKEMYSRRGRFLDSIGDFLVDGAVFAAITHAVYRTHSNAMTIVLGALSLLGITLRVSYHVYYQASFLHLEGRYKLNRMTEEIREEDLRGDRVTLRLQQIFLVIYGWQDRLMERIDRWCMGPDFDDAHFPVWYSDRFGLRLSGFLGFGTELTLLGICSWINALDAYLLINVFVMNGIWAANVMYRRLVLSPNLPRRR
jgi:hypothetical protein